MSRAWFRGTIAVAAYPKDTITVIRVDEWLMPDSTRPGTLSNVDWLNEEFAANGMWDHGMLHGAPHIPGVYEGTVFTYGDDEDSGLRWVSQ